MILSLLFLCSLNGLSSGAPFIPHIPEEHVSTSLHGSITLPCNFSFVQSLEGLSVIWEKKENDKKQIIYLIWKGKEDLEEQDPQYRGRIELSTEFSQGNLDLILRDVTYEDGGTYYCRAANDKDDGDKKVTLSVHDNKKKKESHILVIITGVVIITLTLLIIIQSPKLLCRHQIQQVQNKIKELKVKNLRRSES